MTIRLLFPALLALPGLAGAQSAPLPRYYVGLGLYSSAFQRLGSYYDGASVPVQAVAGYQWRPRWAVQLGVVYYGASSSYTSYGQVLDPATGTPVGDFTDTGHSTDRRASITLLGRRTLTRQAAHRFQADLLGGATYEDGRYRAQGLYVSTDPANPVRQPYDSQGELHRVLVGAGAGLRYRVASRLEASLDLLLSLPLATAVSPGSVAATALGVRYRFGAAR